MSNDNGLVDEYEKLWKIKEETDQKIKKIKEDIVNLAKQKNTNVIFGVHKKCSIKEYEKIIYPESKTEIIELIKKKGLYERFSSINYFKLGPAIIKGEFGQDMLSLIRKEKAFRLSLIDIEK